MVLHERASDFPQRGFVRKAVERHFTNLGYDPLRLVHTDLAYDHRVSGERWIVEAIGETSDMEVTFFTGLKQLLRSIYHSAAHRALAVPKTAAFVRHLRRLTVESRRVVDIHLLLVDEKGGVAFVGPSETLPPDSADRVSDA